MAGLRTPTDFIFADIVRLKMPRRFPVRRCAVARRLRAAAVAVGLMSLAACAGTVDRQTEASATTTPATAAPEPAPALAALPPPDVTPARPPEDARRLIGLKGDALLAWMGDTVFVRRDGTAEIWRFAADICFLDVFLYRESDGLRVAHMDARPRNGTQRITPQNCYGRIMAARPRGGSS